MLAKGAAMTEAKWLASRNPVPMLEHLGLQQVSRKHRLFALACCHRCRRFITDPRSLAALAFAEQHAERGVRGRKGRRAIDEEAAEVYSKLDAERDQVRGVDPVRYAQVLVAIGGCLSAQLLVSRWDESHSASSVSAYLANATAVEWALQNDRDWTLEWDPAAMRPEKAAQAELVRDIFGNPFRPVALDPSWFTPTVRSLARSAYEERVPPGGELERQRLAVLADALEEVGCDRGDILAHLRGPGPHVRGCFVVDSCLGLT
jgi:hypothetical protein